MFGLYRDNGLGVTKASPWQAELIKKEMCSIFPKYGLKVTIEANKTVVNFLDVKLNLAKKVNTCHTTNQETFHSTSTRNLTIHPASSKTSQSPLTKGCLLK